MSSIAQEMVVAFYGHESDAVQDYLDRQLKIEAAVYYDICNDFWSLADEEEREYIGGVWGVTDVDIKNSQVKIPPSIIRMFKHIQKESAKILEVEE